MLELKKLLDASMERANGHSRKISQLLVEATKKENILNKEILKQITEHQKQWTQELKVYSNLLKELHRKGSS